MLFIVSISWVLLIGLVSSQVPSLGKCPTRINHMEYFDYKLFLGQWYEVEKYPLVLEAGGKCTTTTFSLLDDRTISIKTSQINRFTKNGGGFVGRIILSNAGQFTLSLPVQPLSITFEASYWILASDYKNYAVTFACRDIASMMSAEMVWILTRSATPSASTMEKAYAALDRNRISKSYLTHTDQVNCNQTFYETK